MKLGFGKYGDLDISKVPEEYLEWLIRSSKERIKQCQDELDRRETLADADASWMERIVKSGFRHLAKQHHPDAGGTTSEMQELNAAFEALKRKL